MSDVVVGNMLKINADKRLCCSSVKQKYC